MKRNGDKMLAEVDNQKPGSRMTEMSSNATGATTMSLPSFNPEQANRPEIAVLGWNVRSYRLSLRESKI